MPHFAVFVNATICGVVSYPRGDHMYQRIRDLREDRDLKQRQVADYLNCSQQVYSNYELGQRDIPTDILIKLSDFYGVSVDYLLGLTNNPKRNK
jgi:transcriptional regulator with XRE-family HTH domain